MMPPSLWRIITALIPLAGSPAMPQPNCDVVRIARAYVESNFPFINVGSNRRVVNLAGR